LLTQRNGPAIDHHSSDAGLVISFCKKKTMKKIAATRSVAAIWRKSTRRSTQGRNGPPPPSDLRGEGAFGSSSSLRFDSEYPVRLSKNFVSEFKAHFVFYDAALEISEADLVF
jgi:hypothetical protein